MSANPSVARSEPDSPRSSAPGERAARRTRGAFIACAVLLIAFALICYAAVSTKSATSDEPLHAAGAYTHVFMHDYRVNPEDPSLWNYWLLLPRTARSMHVPMDDDLWPKLLSDTAYGMPWSSVILFTAENDGARLIQSLRAMMVPLGVMLGIVIAIWGGQIAGKTGAIVATGLFAFDPNFLAHAGLVKNDIALSLTMAGMCFAVYRAGRRATVLNILCAAALLGAGMSTKFSGVLLGPVFVAMIAARAILPMDWIILGRSLTTVRSRLLGVGLLTLAAAVVAWSVIWMSYGFRFDATPAPGSRLNTAHVVSRTAEERFYLHHHRWPSSEELAAADPGVVARAITWTERHRLLPQAWLYGFLYTYQSTLVRASYLLGRTSDTGWWYYFPLAMLFKTPLATLATGVMAIVVAIVAAVCGRARVCGAQRWTLACLVIPVAFYGASAMSSNLNLGIRHVLPIYPFLYLLIALAATKLQSIRPRVFKWTSAIVAVVLSIETLAAFPDYLSFFNVAAGGSRGGLRLLSDSNLDWGQDLLLLSRWQAAHPNTRLYFCYFGSVDPAVYGIRYLNLPGGTYFNRDVHAPDQPGVIAISASRLQGVHLSPELREFYGQLLKDQQPIDVLGGSIYLFEFPPASSR
ncbi:phospholipid carrier-dependent glycosyltransferase [soil metagenome]